jgi:hypothetical protein
LIPKLPLPAAQLPPVAPALDRVDVSAAIPKLLFPAVQLEAPLLTPAGLAVPLFVPAGFAAEGSAVASVVDEVALALCRYTPGCACTSVPVCCVCACTRVIPAQGKAIAASIAIKNALSALVLLMV